MGSTGDYTLGMIGLGLTVDVLVLLSLGLAGSFSVGVVLGGELGAQAFATIPLSVISLGLIGASRRFTGSSLVGVLSAVTLFWVKPVAESLGYAYIDNGLALFCWSSAMALLLRVDCGDREAGRCWLIVAGLLAAARYSIASPTRHASGCSSRIDTESSWRRASRRHSRPARPNRRCLPLHHGMRTPLSTPILLRALAWHSTAPCRSVSASVHSLRPPGRASRVVPVHYSLTPAPG